MTRTHPGFHVFVVDKFSFPVHSDRLFCGVKNPKNAWQRVGVYSDLLATRPGDFVLFYQRRVDEQPLDRGFRGLYRVSGDPFFDASDVTSGSAVVRGSCPNCHASYSEKTDEDNPGNPTCPACGTALATGDHILPNRLPLELTTYYPRPVDDNSAYIDRTDQGSLWTMIFRKQFGRGRERSINHILPEEGGKLVRLLKRQNSTSPSTPPSGFPAGYPSTTRAPIPFALPNKGPLTAESPLYAWLNQNIDGRDSTVRTVFGPLEHLEYWGNQVLYGIGGDTADYLTLHSKSPGQSSGLIQALPSSTRKDVEDQGGRYGVTVVEVKKDEVDLDTIKQVDRYSYYVSQVASANCQPRPPASLVVQPVVLGCAIEAGAAAEIRKRTPTVLSLKYPDGVVTSAHVLPPRALVYSVSSSALSVTEET